MTDNTYPRQEDAGEDREATSSRLLTALAGVYDVGSTFQRLMLVILEGLLCQHCP